MLDLFGKALLDYQTNNTPESIITETNISEEDEMEVSYLFRPFEEMPKLEQKALKLSKGKVLDVGCGAGSHSLCLQEKGLEVKSLDISKNAIETCRLRGLEDTINESLIDFHTENKFDTILLLMNGTGIFGTLKETSKYLQKLKNLLSENGQIIIDSSDIIYMFDQDEDGAYEIPANGYYGELIFTIHYKGETEESFPWLYMDYNTLQNACHANGLICELIEEGAHFDYLARITK
ncbi:class I SAM-dependent methyltransferase [Flavobacterium columnare]|uniref:Methyltransferase domain-containing protein n=1 Tax=Flavobacterium columnare TaxID=996 RepID=A0AAI8CHM8_9FLAO|nr:methyltransferase domain-containing protein [Flavobacterium columnare]AMO20061.1 methyltransferase domain-containing protein [Flavobacterium columnare]AUX18006.1 methyltransferase [Flavobacterium columnare]QOG57074.1 methyltransferase domain-containing protein [Flavobacterium columnare]QOG59798.1 methyltransferase domain-containing protein [Flavobacterium columnare]QOG62518.1 methyltransferase domain-containing protein [Flavobacterium columnare]